MITVAKILLIDDEEDLVALLKDSLEREGHIVLTARDGFEGIALAQQQPDLIILDIMMPKLDGYEVCGRIRELVACPIIFLSAKQTEADRVRGLVLGGDDYMTKPFSLKELLARVEAHLRRDKRAFLKQHEKGGWLSFQNLTINLRAHQIKLNNVPVPLTKREFEIVELLALHPKQVFSKEQIYEKIWGYDAEGDANTVVEHVRNIRSKLGEVDAYTQYIATVWGIGYRWEQKSL